LDVKKENVVLLFGEIIKEFQNNVSYQQEHVLLKNLENVELLKEEDVIEMYVAVQKEKIIDL